MAAERASSVWTSAGLQKEPAGESQQALSFLRDRLGRLVRLLCSLPAHASPDEMFQIKGGARSMRAVGDESSLPAIEKEGRLPSLKCAANS